MALFVVQPPVVVKSLAVVAFTCPGVRAPDSNVQKEGSWDGDDDTSVPAPTAAPAPPASASATAAPAAAAPAAAAPAADVGDAVLADSRAALGVMRAAVVGHLTSTCSIEEGEEETGACNDVEDEGEGRGEVLAVSDNLGVSAGEEEDTDVDSSCFSVGTIASRVESASLLSRSILESAPSVLVGDDVDDDKDE